MTLDKPVVPVQDHLNRDEPEVSDSESNANAKAKHVKKSLLHERKIYVDDVDDEEVISSRILRLRNHVKKDNLVTRKRKRLFWTAEEEKALKKGVLEFSTENQNIPWRKILEFGCYVFDKTRTPVDLKDKWKNLTSKKAVYVLRRRGSARSSNKPNARGPQERGDTTFPRISCINKNLVTGKSKRLFWTDEEVKALKEPVSK